MSTPKSPMPDDTDRPLRGEEEPAGVVDELHAAGEVALFEGLRDPSSPSAKRVLGQVFERELDELSTPPGSSYFSDKPAEDASEEEKRKREERLLLGEVAGHCGNQLRPYGIRVRKVERDVEAERGGGEYVLRAQDAQGRAFEVKFGYSMALRLKDSGGQGNLVERMAHAVTREVLEQRKKWIDRSRGGGQ